jgi:nucleotidyltransferase substrate binding protein (TIGR01987 family)
MDAASFDITGVTDAVNALERSIQITQKKENEKDVDKNELETLHAGVIQSFEFSYELCWKFMKRWISMNVSSDIVDGVTRIELFRRAAENYLISDVKIWMRFHEARNRTSHEYSSIMANDVYESAIAFLPYAKQFLDNLGKKL